MKLKILLSSLLILFSAQALALNIEDEVAALKKKASSLDRPSLYALMVKLKNSAQEQERKLDAGRGWYDPDGLYYAMVIGDTLKILPNVHNGPEYCFGVRGHVSSLYREPWEEMPTPVHDVWPLIERLCE